MQAVVADSTAIATVITALGGLILAIAVLIPNLHVSKQTHAIVRQALTDSLDYQAALIRALLRTDIDLPEDGPPPPDPGHNETPDTS